MNSTIVPPLPPRQVLFADLDAQGLNLQAVFALDTLPAEVLHTLALSDAERAHFRQLILVGHRGRRFWAALQERGMHGAHPVDQFVTECIAASMNGPLLGHAWQQVFPGPQAMGLQSLGQLAGWHHASPFWVGVHQDWGSWFAYRAVVLADTDLPLTPRLESPSPCDSCASKPCISACPAGALASSQTGAWQLRTCIDYRKLETSACQDRCLARNACPVGAAHRYDDAQIRYHYLHSMRAIRQYY